MKKVRDGKLTVDPAASGKLQPHRLFNDKASPIVRKKGGRKSKEPSSDQRQMGLITTQLLNKSPNSTVVVEK